MLPRLPCANRHSYAPYRYAPVPDARLQAPPSPLLAPFFECLLEGPDHSWPPPTMSLVLSMVAHSCLAPQLPPVGKTFMKHSLPLHEEACLSTSVHLRPCGPPISRDGGSALVSEKQTSAAPHLNFPLTEKKPAYPLSKSPDNKVIVECQQPSPSAIPPHSPAKTSQQPPQNDLPLESQQSQSPLEGLASEPWQAGINTTSLQFSFPTTQQRPRPSFPTPDPSSPPTSPPTTTPNTPILPPAPHPQPRKRYRHPGTMPPKRSPRTAQVGLSPGPLQGADVTSGVVATMEGPPAATDPAARAHSLGDAHTVEKQETAKPWTSKPDPYDLSAVFSTDEDELPRARVARPWASARKLGSHKRQPAPAPTSVPRHSLLIAHQPTPQAAAPRSEEERSRQKKAGRAAGDAKKAERRRLRAAHRARKQEQQRQQRAWAQEERKRRASAAARRRALDLEIALASPAKAAEARVGEIKCAAVQDELVQQGGRIGLGAPPHGHGPSRHDWVFSEDRMGAGAFSPLEIHHRIHLQMMDARLGGPASHGRAEKGGPGTETMVDSSEVKTKAAPSPSVSEEGREERQKESAGRFQGDV